MKGGIAFGLHSGGASSGDGRAAGVSVAPLPPETTASSERPACKSREQVSLHPAPARQQPCAADAVTGNGPCLQTQLKA
jgi:hypothetical protein